MFLHCLEVFLRQKSYDRYVCLCVFLHHLPWTSHSWHHSLMTKWDALKSWLFLLFEDPMRVRERDKTKHDLFMRRPLSNHYVIVWISSHWVYQHRTNEQWKPPDADRLDLHFNTEKIIYKKMRCTRVQIQSLHEILNRLVRLEQKNHKNAQR